MGGVRLCPHFSSSGLTPMSSACATAQVTAANDFSMPTALGDYRLSWHLCLTQSQLSHSPPSRNSNLPGTAHLQFWGESGSPRVSVDPGTAHQPWPHCCQCSVPPHSDWVLPSPLPLRSSRCPSQLQGQSTASQLGTQPLWGKGTLLPSPQLLAFRSIPSVEAVSRIQRRTHP